MFHVSEVKRGKGKNMRELMKASADSLEQAQGRQWGQMGRKPGLWDPETRSLCCPEEAPETREAREQV